MLQKLSCSISAQGRILDRVWQVFGPETIPLIEEKLTCEKVQVKNH